MVRLPPQKQSMSILRFCLYLLTDFLFYSYKHTQFSVFEKNFDRRIERNLRANITVTPEKEEAQNK